MIKQVIKQIIISNSTLKKYYIQHKEKNGSLIKIEDINLNSANKVILTNKVSGNIFVGLVKDGVTELNEYIVPRAYYTKYERFLKNNNIKYEYFDIHANNWIEQAKKYNVVIWQTDSSPVVQTEARQKIYVLEQIGIKCLPSFNEVFKFEDKVEMHYFYKTNNLPEIPTFVSNSKEDAITFAKNTKYPIISKITTSSSSFGVSLLKSKRQTIKLINQVFSEKGKKTHWKYLRQKDYVYFQQFIDDAEFDLRVIVVGNSLFGYYRYPNKGDYRASGAGNYEKKEIPEEALDIAWNTHILYDSQCLATDFVFSKRENKYFIIESSIFIGVDTEMQLKINNIPGRYIRGENGFYSFEEGKYWIQELALKNFFEKEEFKTGKE